MALDLPPTIHEDDIRINKNYKPTFYKRLQNAGKVTKQNLQDQGKFKIASSDTVTLKDTRTLENFPVWFGLNVTPLLSCRVDIGLYSCRSQGVLHLEVRGEQKNNADWRTIQEGYVSLHEVKFVLGERLDIWKQLRQTEEKSNPKFVLLVNINNIILLATKPFQFGQNNELRIQPKVQRPPVTPSSPRQEFKIVSNPTVSIINGIPYVSPNVDSNVITFGEALMLQLHRGGLPPLELSLVPNYHYIHVEVKAPGNICTIKCDFREGLNQITLFGQIEHFWVLPMLVPPNDLDVVHPNDGSFSSPQERADGPDNHWHGGSGSPFSFDNNNNNNNNDGTSHQDPMQESDANTPNDSENNEGNDPSQDLDSESPEETEITITEVLPSSIPIGVSQLAAVLGNFKGIPENARLEITFGGRRGFITSWSSDCIFAKTPIFATPRPVNVTLLDARTGEELATKENALLVDPPPQQLSLTAQLAHKDKEIAQKNTELAQKNRELAQKNTELARKDEQIQQLSSQVPAANVQLEYNVQQENENSNLSTKANEQIQPLSIAHLEKSLQSFGESRFVDFIKQESQLEQICNPLNKSDWRMFGEQLGFKSNQLDDIEKKYKESPARQLLKEWETKSDSTMKNYITALVNINHPTAVNKMSELFPKYIADIEGIAETQRREKRITDLTQLTDSLKTQIHSLSQDKAEVDKLRGEKHTLERQLDTLQAEIASTSSRRDRDGTKIPNPWILMACIIAVIGIGIVFYVPTPSGPLSPPSPSYPQSSAFSPTPLSSPYPMSSLNPPSSPNPTTAWQTIQPTIASDYYHSTSVTITYVSNDYLHVTGNTYRIKEMLKQHGARWLPNDKAWKIPNVPRKAEELSQIIKTMYPTEHVVIVDGRGKTNADVPGQR